MMDFRNRSGQKKDRFVQKRLACMRRMNRPENLFGNPYIANLLVALFVFIDLLCMKNLWDAVQTASAAYVWFVSGASAAALDIPLAIMAVVIKSYRQGMCSKFTKNITIILAGGVFAAALLGSIFFRLETREITFEVTGSGMSEIAAKYGVEIASGAADTSVVLAAAVFNAMVPLFTSVTSFIVSFYAADPLGKKLRELQVIRCRLQHEIRSQEKAIEALSDPDRYYDRLLKQEAGAYRGYTRLLDAQEMELKFLARQMIMEQIGRPEAVTKLTRSSEEILKQYKERESDQDHVYGDSGPQYENPFRRYSRQAM